MLYHETDLQKITQWRPPFVREIRELAEDEGLLAATHDLLLRDNIRVAARGYAESVKNYNGGMLFVGNHNKQFEFVALMDMLSQMGRTSMKNIVKFYVEDQVKWALGSVGTDILLPVYPRLLARDRKNKINLELGSRIVFHRNLKTTAESAYLNEVSLQAATEELAEGGVVNIYPCGSIVNNMARPWRPGVGRIIAALPEEHRDDVLVVPYHANTINRTRLFGAVAVRGRGVLGRPQNITIEFGQPLMATELIDTLPITRQSDPSELTDALR